MMRRGDDVLTDMMRAILIHFVRSCSGIYLHTNKLALMTEPLPGSHVFSEVESITFELNWAYHDEMSSYAS